MLGPVDSFLDPRFKKVSLQGGYSDFKTMSYWLILSGWSNRWKMKPWHKLLEHPSYHTRIPSWQDPSVRDSQNLHKLKDLLRLPKCKYNSLRKLMFLFYLLLKHCLNTFKNVYEKCKRKLCVHLIKSIQLLKKKKIFTWQASWPFSPPAQKLLAGRIKIFSVTLLIFLTHSLSLTIGTRASRIRRGIGPARV